jgi:GxxExxY protein
MPSVSDTNSLTHEIIGAAMKVHRVLGPGLLERPYELCLAFELQQRGLQVDEQRAVPLVYEDVKLDCVYRLDMVVNDSVIVEVKAIESLTDVHVCQMLTYLRLTGISLGLLMNFHAPTLKAGLKSVINSPNGLNSARL